MRQLSLIVLAAIILTTAAAAQDQPVLLRYKFTPGQTDTHVLRGTGTLPVSINPGPEAQIPGMGFDMTLDMQLTTKQVCRSVEPDGSGVVDVTFPAFTVRTTVQVAEQPVDALLKWENGKLSNMVNGTEQPPDDNTRKLAQVLAATLTMTIRPTGEQIPDANTIKLMNDLYSASMFTGLDLTRLSALTSRLPVEPVAPGATWNVADEANNDKCTIRGHSTLKFVGMEDFVGTPTARIEGQATMTMNGQMTGAGTVGMGFSYNLTGLEVNLAFVNHLDPVRGVMPISQVNMTENMAMVVSVGGIAGAQTIHLPTTIENGQMSYEVRKQ